MTITKIIHSNNNDNDNSEPVSNTITMVTGSILAMFNHCG